MKSKIQNDIDELVAKEVISKDMASKIEAYYLSKITESSKRLFTVFALIGTTLVGLGIILILAHNWDEFTRPIKTSFAFLPLLIGQLFVGYSILKNKNSTWKESSGVFLFFAVGSSVALVSQIYNIPGDLSSFLLIWVLLCLPIIYLLKSNALAELHIVFITSYAVEYGYFYGHIGTPWLYVLLLASVLPFYFNLLKFRIETNTISVFNWLLPLSVIIVLGAFIDKNEELGYLMYVFLFGLLHNLGMLPYFNNQKLRQNGYLILGSVGTIFVLLITSFEWMWNAIFKEAVIFNSQELLISIIFFLCALSILVYGHNKKWFMGINLFQYVFIIFTLIFFIGLNNSTIPVIITNLLILTLGLMAIKIGTDKLHFGILNYGFLIITVQIVCRFFDTNVSFVLRGLLFVGVGIGFFFANYMMMKKKKSIQS